MVEDSKKVHESLEAPQKNEDSITDMIGGIGRWQTIRITICWLLALPGMCHTFAVAFETIVPEFYCANAAGEPCAVGCNEYHFNTSFWRNTVPMEFKLVCDRFYLICKKVQNCILWDWQNTCCILVVSKAIFFCGCGIGSLIAGILSDSIGRKSALSIFSQILCGCGILASVTSNFAIFCILWFFVGKHLLFKTFWYFFYNCNIAGFGAFAVFNVGFIWTIEIVGSRWKSTAGLLYSSAISSSL